MYDRVRACPRLPADHDGSARRGRVAFCRTRIPDAWLVSAVTYDPLLGGAGRGRDDQSN